MCGNAFVPRMFPHSLEHTFLQMRSPNPPKQHQQIGRNEVPGRVHLHRLGARALLRRRLPGRRLFHRSGFGGDVRRTGIDV